MPDVAVLTITDPGGTDWILDGTNGYWEGRGRKGFHGQTYEHYRDDSPAVAGSFWRGVRALAKELFLPVVIKDPDRNLALAKRRALTKAISPVHGECILTSAYPDGSARKINCRYVDGIDGGEQGPGDYGVTVYKYGLRFVADDPYFYGDLITSSWSLAAQSRTELPIPGADTFFEVVSSPLIADGAVLTNIGDVDAYPTWQFDGPFTSIVAQNATTGKTWTIVHTAIAGNSLFLNTEPGQTSLVDQAGVNRWDKLTAGYQLWPLAAHPTAVNGNNTVNITVVGADTVTSAATLTYRPLFEGD